MIIWLGFYLWPRLFAFFSTAGDTNNGLNAFLFPRTESESQAMTLVRAKQHANLRSSGQFTHNLPPTMPTDVLGEAFPS